MTDEHLKTASTAVSPPAPWGIFVTVTEAGDFSLNGNAGQLLLPF